MGTSVSRNEVVAARRKYQNLKNTFEEQQVTPQIFPVFPSGGDPKIEVFNLMSRTLEERTALISQAEQGGGGEKWLRESMVVLLVDTVAGHSLNTVQR